MQEKKTAKTIARERLRDVVEWWNARVDFMVQIIQAADDPDMEHFKWSQLVWQEIEMFIRLGKKIKVGDMKWICRRRGFSAAQTQMLKDAMAHVGLWHEKQWGVQVPPPAQCVVIDATEMEFDAFVEAVEDSQGS